MYSLHPFFFLEGIKGWQEHQAVLCMGVSEAVPWRRLLALLKAWSRRQCSSCGTKPCHRSHERPKV